MEIIVDSNIILDILTEDKKWYGWSSEMLTKYSQSHKLIINQVIYSEVSIRFSKIEDLDSVLEKADLIYENLPWAAAFLAGKCFMRYKQKSGNKTSPLPDFYIGAHAAVTNRILLTRDTNRYKAYFRRLRIISSEFLTLEEEILL